MDEEVVIIGTTMHVVMLVLTVKKHYKRPRVAKKKMTFVELTSQKKFGFTKNDSGMGILKKTSKRKENFFRIRKLILNEASRITFSLKITFFILYVKETS